MGRAARWLLALLRGKKSAEAGSPSEKRSEKEKKRWGFVKSFREREKGQNRQKQCPIQPLLSEQKAGSYRDGRMPLMSESDEQGRRAVAVVGLTTSSRSVGFVTGEKYECAAIKIQASFRGYLARRALRALKGLVKLQALARGNIVRKQAVETLRCMKALVRVQTRARDGRALLSETSRSTKSSRSNPGPPTPEKYESATRSDASKTTNLSGSLKRNSSKKTRLDNAHKERSTEHWNWLDQWMEERYLDSGEVSKPENDEKNAKFLEMNTGKPANRNSNRRTNKISSYSSILYSDQNSRCLSGMPDSPSKDSTTAQLSIPSPSSSVHNIRQSRSPLRFPIIEHEDQGGSPKFFSAASRSGSSRRGSFTPAKSDYSRSLLSDYSDNPNYMANTESSRAKARSVSAPKQRPTEFEKSNTISRLSGQGLIAQRSSLHFKFLNKAYPGSGRLDRLGLPIRM